MTRRNRPWVSRREKRKAARARRDFPKWIKRQRVVLRDDCLFVGEKHVGYGWQLPYHDGHWLSRSIGTPLTPLAEA